MFARLLAAGARGFHRPDLIIHHYVPPERLTKRYFRRWCFWRGVSLGVLDKKRPAAVPYLLGVPRYMIGSGMRGTMETVRSLFGRRDPAQTFKNELAWWDVAGFSYGKHGYGLEQRVSGIFRRLWGATKKQEEWIRALVGRSGGRRSAPLANDKSP